MKNSQFCGSSSASTDSCLRSQVPSRNVATALLIPSPSASHSYNNPGLLNQLHRPRAHPHLNRSPAHAPQSATGSSLLLDETADRTSFFSACFNLPSLEVRGVAGASRRRRGTGVRGREDEWGGQRRRGGRGRSSMAEQLPGEVETVVVEQAGRRKFAGEVKTARFSISAPLVRAERAIVTSLWVE